MEKSPRGLSLERANNQIHTQGVLPHPSSSPPPPPPPPMMMISNNSTSSTISSSSSEVFHHNHHHHHHHHQNSNPSTPRTPQPTNTNNNPYPTTFVQADTCSFKHVVQMLTGSSETAKLAASSKPTTPHSPAASSSDPNLNSKNIFIPPIRPVSKPKPSKLYERRNSLRAGLGISPLVPGSSKAGYSPQQQQQQQLLSPSLLLNFPGLVLSPVTPLIPDPFNRSLSSASGNNNNNNNNNNAVIVDKFAEEKAIAEKGFYLHPSPRELTTSSPNPPPPPPRLLPLFPVTSPKVSASTSTSDSTASAI